jgi:spore germination cell wall hydrolase CwlJ-like protein
MVDDLGDYDVTPVEGNPFGAMASSPNDYDVSPVDHDPFAGAGENPAPDQFELASRQPEATPSSAGGPPLDPRDRDLLIKTVYGEASGEPPQGQAGIVHAILNRVRAGTYGQGIPGVVMAPAAGENPKYGYHEFSPWNTGRAKEGNPVAQHLSPDSRDPNQAAAYRNIGDVVDKAYSGLMPDQTGGATHYYGRMRGHPWWSPPLAAQNQVRIGGTTFVGREHGPGETPSQMAGGYAGGGPVQLNADLRRRLALIRQPRHGFQTGGAPDDPNAAGFSALDQMTGRADRAAEPAPPPAPTQASTDSLVDPETGLPSFDPATNVPREPQTQVSGGQWGKAAELGYEDVVGKLGAAQSWLGDKAEQYTGSTLAAIGVPGATGFARDIRGMMESGELGPPASHNHPSFPEGRIATRVPSAVGPLADAAHQSNAATIGLDTIQSTPSMYAKTANVAREMPYVPGPVVDGKPTWTPTHLLNFAPDATDDEVHEGLVNHFKSNILALHDAVSPDVKQGSQLWYDGANNRASQKALTYGKPVENTAGVYAALSPQKDWFENVSLGDRVMDIMHNQQDTPFTPQMWKWASKYAKGDPDTLATYRMFKNTGRTLGQINDPENQALWLRAFDEAHNPRDYNIVNPDGTFGPTATNTDGSNSRVAWGSMNMIEKAITAFNAPDMPTISGAMGDRHKVRNFFNNIVAPNSQQGDVTVDTHAIAGANLRPMAGDDKDVDIGLGGSGGSNRSTGAKGLYGAYAEAYRRAAADRNILPRQMQSITWEALRGLWTPAEKASPDVNAAVQNVWNLYQMGHIDLPTAQRMIMTDPTTGASRIRPPDWHTAGWRPQG